MQVAYGLDINAVEFAEVVKRGSEEEAIYNLSAWDQEAVPPALKKKEELVRPLSKLHGGSVDLWGKMIACGRVGWNWSAEKSAVLLGFNL